MVYNRYPKSHEAAWALYRAADLYTKLHKYSNESKDLDAALALYRKLATQHEKHFLADDAQYKIGEIYYKMKKDPSQAYVEFLKVDVRFPKGDMRPQSQKEARPAGDNPEQKNKTGERGPGIDIQKTDGPWLRIFVTGQPPTTPAW